MAIKSNVDDNKYINGVNICKVYIGFFLIEKIFLGDKLIYVQSTVDIQFIDNILYVNNINMYYNEEEKTLYIDEDYINYDSEQYNLRIEGEN